MPMGEGTAVVEGMVGAVVEFLPHHHAASNVMEKAVEQVCLLQ